MTNDPSPGRRPGLGRLWTEPRETEEHTPWLEPKRARARAPPLAATATAPTIRATATTSAPLAPPPGLLGILVGTAIAALLVGAGVLGASLLGGDDDNVASPPRCPSSPAPRPPTSAAARSARSTPSAKDSVVPVRVARAQSGRQRHRLRHRQGRRDRHERARRQGRPAGRRCASSDEGRLRRRARCVGTDLSSDLAVLRVDSSAAAKLRPLPLADSDKVQRRRPDARDRLPARAQPLGVGVGRHRLGARALDRRRRTSSRSRRSSRPTPRSTPATPAGRCWTRSAA